MTMSFERDSLICTLVIERLSTRVRRYSALMVMLFCSVTSTPSSGENDSLIETVGTCHPSTLAVSEPLV